MTPTTLPASELRLLAAPPATTDATRSAAEAHGGQTPWWLTTACALAVVLILIFVLRALLTRWAGRSAVGGNSALIEVLHRAAVAPRQYVLLIRMGSRLLLVNESPNGLRTLATIRDPQEVAELLTNLATSKSSSTSAGFHDLLRRVTGGQRDQETRDGGGDDQEYLVDSARDELSGLASRLRAMAPADPNPTPEAKR
jgi:flagellar biogenesis protein FliO